ncbi:HET-domain-containing protein [Lentithecium fluviatile CBS 122367]|uniref:HET-domain-containing protein n=1 Tax=Lentithecium fluviatile CBS 122367 TaxID=1168545 RepID=A0A6G1JEG2_9PLEO|nr:HET-domain-containing protein [Lentithecium fluviatile CBS 122367]
MLLGSKEKDVRGEEYKVACALWEEGKYGEAEDLFRQVQGWEKQLGEDHEATLNSKKRLGRILCSQKRYTLAEKLFRQVVQAKEEEPGNAIINWLSVKHWLGCPLYGQKDIPTFHTGASASVEEYARSSLECLYCRLLLNVIDQVHPGWICEQRDIKFIKISSLRLSWHSQPYIQLHLVGKGLERIGFNDIEIRIDTDDDSTWNVDLRGSLSRFEWEQAESWLRDCVHSHAICRTPNIGFVPKRLVQVIDGDSGLRLVERDDLKLFSEDYCALSYCWGLQGNTLTTRKENLEHHLRGMRLSSMPQTIQDAVIVCRSLHIPYLWVDALCIVQNDDGERDWYEQSSEMCEIYSNAHLVISADASPTSNFGFLPGRDRMDKRWETSRVFDTESDRRIIASVRTHDANTTILYTGRAWDGKSINPLLQRGWALQESMLANRLLRFTSCGMQWQCNHAHRDEMGLMSRAIRLAKLTRLYPSLKSSLPQSAIPAISIEEEKYTRHITDFMNQNSSASIYHAWQGIVSYYSERDLTKIADKLSALSGLARLVSDALQCKPDAYLAGHWKDDLASSLLWYVSRSKVPNRSSPYRAPTWSWASVNCQVRYFQEQYQFLFKTSVTIHSAHCQPSPLDSFGRVTSGKLSVTGMLTPVSLHISPTKSHQIQYTGKGGCAGHPYTDQFSWVSLFGGSALEHVDPVFYYEVLLDDKTPADAVLLTDIKCLLVGRHKDTMTEGSRVWWLVLKRTLVDEECWERIGIGYFHERWWEQELFNERWAEMGTVTLV